MNYRLLGRSGLRVSELCLGTMGFGTEWGFGAERDEVGRIWDAFAEAGGNFIDTADKYTNGTSERMVGELIASDREYWVLATKYSLATRDGDPNNWGNHRKNLVHSVEASLKRLNTDVIDLLWLHAWTFDAPISEVMRALDDLVRAGKVLYIGISDTPAWVIARANTMAELRGWTPFTALQVEWSLIERTVERELVPMAKELGLGITPWGPLAGGVLTGKYTKGDGSDTKRAGGNEASGRLTERALSIARAVDAVADAVGRSPAQVALAWVRAKGAIPIVGSRHAGQLRDTLACVDLTLGAEHLAELDAASAIDHGFPTDFMKTAVSWNTFGDTFSRLDRGDVPW